MQDVVRTRVLLFVVGLLVVPIATVTVILFAKGYRPNFKTKELFPTGLLVVHSYPEGAQVLVNSQTRSATNTTINLSPGSYFVEIKKAGYQPWQKNFQVEAEIVTRATATLFPSVPTLKQITSQGADLPTLSPDGTKAVYTSFDRKELFLLDLNESPLGLINRDSKQVTRLQTAIDSIRWSPDSRQVLLNTPASSASAFLVDVNSSQTRSVSAIDPVRDTNWQNIAANRDLQKFSALPEQLQTILATSSAYLSWSPRENKLLYTATSSATIPVNLKRPLPGSSTQLQDRNLTPGSVYVYDIEEDRNFKVDQTSLVIPTPSPKHSRATSKPAPGFPPPDIITVAEPNANLKWLPTSSHLIRVETQTIIIFEYDGQNPTTVYSGPLDNFQAIPYPSAKQMLILANLTSTPTPDRPAIPNLYALTLR